MLFIIPFLSFGQIDIPELKITALGVDPIVVHIDSMSAKELYKKTLKWVQKTYISPENVLKGNIENENIRVQGKKENAFSYSNWPGSFSGTMYYDAVYMFDLDFRDGRFRATYQPMTFYLGGTLKEVSGYSSWFAKQKDTKKGAKIQAINDNAIVEFNIHMNELVKNLHDYLISSDEDDKW